MTHMPGMTETAIPASIVDADLIVYAGRAILRVDVEDADDGRASLLADPARLPALMAVAGARPGPDGCGCLEALKGRPVTAVYSSVVGTLTALRGADGAEFPAFGED